MMHQRQCIVCGRSIRKRVHDVSVRPVSGNAGGLTSPAIHADLRTKADCARQTNAPHIVSIRRNYLGLVTGFSTWDGESFVDRYFCTNSCAQRQGYASAYSGQRFTWEKVR